MSRILSLLVVMTSVACSAITPPIEKPIIQDEIGNTGTLAVTADRRLVLVNKQSGKFVAEPSPDAYTEIASLTKLAAEADISGQGSGEASFARALATGFQRLGRRSQGVTFYRDASYRLAEAAANAWVTPAEFKAELQAIAKLAKALILKELDGNPTLSDIEFTESEIDERIKKLQELKKQLDS